MNFFKNTIIFLKTIKTKPLDFVIIFVLFLASFSTIFLFATGSTGVKAELRISGKVIKTFDLKKNQTWTYRDKDGDYNKIEVKNGEIAVVEAKAEVDGKLAASGTLTFAIGN